MAQPRLLPGLPVALVGPSAFLHQPHCCSFTRSRPHACSPLAWTVVLPTPPSVL